MNALLWSMLAGASPPDPLLEGLPADGRVLIERGPQTWSVIVGGRPMIVPAPRTAAEEAAIRALILSLLSGLDLVPAAPLPPPVAVAPPPPPPPPVPVIVLVTPPPPPPPPPEPPPAPAPAPAPVAAAPALAPPPTPERTLKISPWIGADLVLRPQVSPGAGLTLGARAGERGGVGVRFGARLPRQVTAGGESHLLEGTGDLELWGAILPWISWGLGFGGAGRLYSVPDALVAAHVAPRATARLWLPVDTGPVTLSLGIGGEVDLVPTQIGPLHDYEPLPPTALRIETQLEL